MARYLSLAMSVGAARGIRLLVAPLDTTCDALVHGKRRPRDDFVGGEQRAQPRIVERVAHAAGRLREPRVGPCDLGVGYRHLDWIARGSPLGDPGRGAPGG